MDGEGLSPTVKQLVDEIAILHAIVEWIVTQPSPWAALSPAERWKAVERMKARMRGEPVS